MPMIKLQPFRIPSNWEVSYNSFTELDPVNLGKKPGEWINFTENLLQIKNIRYNILLDVGWYPEGDPNGSYGVELIKDNDWQNPLVSFNTANKKEVVEKIELLLWQVGEGFYN
jgi:hypothetical protein